MGSSAPFGRRSFLAGALASQICACATAPPREGSLSISNELDDLIATALEQLDAVAGMSIAVYTAAGAYTGGFGVADVTTSEPVTADTAFYIASSTKPLTALALSIKSARGELDLQSSLASLAPDADWPDAIRPNMVSVKNLLTHSSGFDNTPIAFRVAYTGQHDPELLWRLLAASRPNDDAPYGSFQYTNTGYNIATILTDRRFNENWQDMLSREVFAPVGMNRASARMSTALAGGWSVAKPHLTMPEGVTKVYLEKTDQTMQSAGGVIMSANDAVRLLELMINDGAFRGRQVIPSEAVRATRARLVTLSAEFAGYTREAYGLGWYHSSYRNEPMLHHFGGFFGARAHISYLPGRRIGVAAFVNDSSVGAQLPDAVANFVYDRTAGRADAVPVFQGRISAMMDAKQQRFSRILQERAARARVAWNPEQFPAHYAGVYENELFGRIEIAPLRDGLVAHLGVLHSIVEPDAEPETLRIEFYPGVSERAALRRQGAVLHYDGQDYARDQRSSAP